MLFPILPAIPAAVALVEGELKAVLVLTCWAQAA